MKERIQWDEPLVNVFSSFVTSNKTDSLDIGVVADSIDGGNTSVDDVEDTRWQAYEEDQRSRYVISTRSVTGSFAKLSNDHCGTRVSLGGFQNEGVASNGS